MSEQAGQHQYPQFGLDYFAYNHDSERLDAVIGILQREGLYDNQLLFCGFNGISTVHGAYPEREEMYATNEENWRGHMQTWSHDSGPFFYALFEEYKQDCIPALGAYDSKLLKTGEDGSGHFVSRSGGSIGEACVAIVYFGNMIWEREILYKHN